MPYPLTDDAIVPGTWQHRGLTCTQHGLTAFARPIVGPAGATAGPGEQPWRCVSCMRRDERWTALVALDESTLEGLERVAQEARAFLFEKGPP